MSCGVGCRHSSDPVLLWYRPAATAPIQPVAWEVPCVVDVALKRTTTTTKKLVFVLRSPLIPHRSILFLCNMSSFGFYYVFKLFVEFSCSIAGYCSGLGCCYYLGSIAGLGNLHMLWAWPKQSSKIFVTSIGYEVASSNYPPF